MTKRYITLNGHKYLIRGNYNATQIREHFDTFCQKYTGYTKGIEEWARYYGKVYVRVS